MTEILVGIVMFVLGVLLAEPARHLYDLIKTKIQKKDKSEE